MSGPGTERTFLGRLRHNTADCWHVGFVPEADINTNTGLLNPNQDQRIVLAALLRSIISTGGHNMWRAIMFLVTFIVFAGTNPALADWKSDCLNGVAMIKAELKKKHPQPVLDQLQKALDRVQIEVMENDWVECREYVVAARKALQK